MLAVGLPPRTATQSWVADVPQFASRAILAIADARTRQSCRETLEAHGFRVQVADATCSAVGLAAAASDAILISDWAGRTTDMLASGTEGGSPAVPTVFVCDDSVAARMLESDLTFGLCEVVVMPLRPSELMLRIRALHQRAELVRRHREDSTARGEQARILATLHEHVGRLVSEDDLGEALSAAAAFAQQAVSAREVIVWLPAEQRLRAAAVLGEAGCARNELCGALDSGWLGAAYVAGETLLIDTPGRAPTPALPCEQATFRNFPLLLIPLRADGRSVGVLSFAAFGSGHPFGVREQECAALVGGITGTALRQILVRQSRDSARDMIVFALAELAEYRDSTTGHHLERVKRYALALARELQQGSAHARHIDATFLYSLERAAPLHDIGKVAIPDSILLKPGPLSEPEMAIMRTHAEIGWKALTSVTRGAPNIPFLTMAADIACAHHERFDGKGYPRRLAGDAIPLAARVVTLVDVYDALTTVRSYKPAIPHETARTIVEQGIGGAFDPIVGAAFLARETEFERIAREFADTPDPRRFEHMETSI